MMSKTVLITGASGGIGKELADRFAKDGYDLVLVARSEDKLVDLAGGISEEVPCPNDIHRQRCCITWRGRGNLQGA